MGELRKFYALADVVFVGRSLVPMGGSDPIEVAALGKGLIAGPHMENFQSAVEAFKKVHALCTVRDALALAKTVASLLCDVERREQMGQRARQIVLDNQGATARTVERLKRLLLDE